MIGLLWLYVNTCIQIFPEVNSIHSLESRQNIYFATGLHWISAIYRQESWLMQTLYYFIA